MNFSDVLRTAIHALRGNWMRSTLTSLGVIIGIAAVIVMVSVGQGTQAEIDRMVSGLGSQRLDISPGSRRMGGGARQAGSAFYTLTEGDAEAIRAEIPEVQLVTGQLRGSSQVVLLGGNVNDPGEMVLFLTIDFAVRARSINGYIALLMDLPSITAIKTLIRRYLRGLEET